MPDADQIVDSLFEQSESKLHSDSDAGSEATDPDATYVPDVDVQSKIKEWDGSLTDDGDPGNTLKSPQAIDKSSTNTPNHSVELKRRDVADRDCDKRQSSRKNGGRRVAIRGDAGSEFISVYAICSHVGLGDATVVCWDIIENVLQRIRTSIRD